jgi:maleate isomerase
MTPRGVSLHSAPVPLGVRTANNRGRDPAAGSVGLEDARAFAESPKLDEAAELLARIPLTAIAYAFSSSSYALGASGDDALKLRLEKQTRGIPIAVAGVSARLALHALNIRRVAIVHPPWFSPHLDQQGAEYFRTAGFDVVYHAPATMPFEYGGVDPAHLYQWLRANVPKDMDGVMIGGNGFRAIGAIDALEHALGKPVVTANQVAFWHAMRAGRIQAAVAGYGRLFRTSLPV